MLHQRRLAQQLSVEELDRELIARGAKIAEEKRFKFKDREGTPERACIMAQVKEFYDAAISNTLSPREDLRHLSTRELVKTLRFKTMKFRVEGRRGIWYDDNRKDFYQIEDEEVRKNAECVAAICDKADLTAEKNGYSSLKTKKFGKAFNLCKDEPFYEQPVAAGRLHSCFLVEEDIIATADHCISSGSLSRFRFLFGFKMLDFSTPVEQVPNTDIYRGVELIERVYNRTTDNSDWALVKLDRKVKGHPVVKFPDREVISRQPVYVIGHPCGLPLKYAAGAKVKTVENAYFSADLDVFSGNSGSPVFNGNTHELVGIAVRGDFQNFRWTRKGWMYIKYPHPDLISREPRCTRQSEFSSIVGKLRRKNKNRRS